MLKNIFKLSWRNIWRNKRRTLLTLLAIAVGVLSIIFAKSYITGLLNNTIEAMIETESGHIRLAHKEYLRLSRIMPKEYMVTGLNQLQPAVEKLPGVTSTRAQIKFNVLLNFGDINEAGVAVGIEPTKMDRDVDLSKTVIQGHYFSEKPEGKGLELIIGSKLAEKLYVKVGDELLLVTTDINYSTYALPFRIVGIFETGFSYFDRHLLYIPLEKAREMLDCGDSAQELLVFLEDRNQSWELAGAIQNLLDQKGLGADGAITVQPWQKHDMIASFPMIEQIWEKILWILMFIAALVILNTMLMAVMERYHEIGVIKAMGLKNREAFLMILVEAFYLGLIGSAVGGLIGGVLSAALEKTGINVAKLTNGLMDKIEMPIPFFGKTLYPDLTPEILIGSVLFGIAIALVAVLYPAFKSARMSPVEAFHSDLKV